MLLVARNLGSTSWGLLSIANSIVTLVQLFQDIGIRDALVIFISQNRGENKPGNVRVFMKAGLLISLTTAIILTLVLVVLSDYIAINWYNEPDLGFLVRILSLAIIGRALLFGSYGVTVGFERMELRGSLRIVYSFMKSIVSPFLVLFGLGTLGGVLGEVGPILIAGGLGLYFTILLYKNLSDEEPEISLRSAIKTIFSFSLPLYLANLLTSTRMQLLTFLMGLYLGDEITGNWTIVLWFSSLLSFINLPVRTTIYPLFSKTTDISELEYVYKNSIKFATLLTYPIAFTIMALSDQIIEALFTSDYVYAALFLRLYMITFLFSGVGGSSNVPLLNSQMKTKETFRIKLIPFLITIPSCIVVIPRYGAVAAIILLILGMTVSKFYAVSRVWNIFGFRFHLSSTIKMMLAGLTSSGFTYYLFSRISVNPWIELMAGGCVSVLLYLTLILLMKTLTQADYIRLNKLGKELGPVSKPFLIFLTLIEKINSHL
jgi:O-antigen/teichoic acid export membrane protein